MQEQHELHAAEQVRRFFAQAAALSPAQVRALGRVHRSRTTSPLAFAVHPERLSGVSSGTWTHGHDVLVAQAHTAARRQASRLAPLGRRRALAVVLQGTALAVIVNSLPDPVLSAALRERLAEPWTSVVGPLPLGRLHVAVAH